MNHSKALWLKKHTTYHSTKVYKSGSLGALLLLWVGLSWVNCPSVYGQDMGLEPGCPGISSSCVVRCGHLLSGAKGVALLCDLSASSTIA